jgi:hypothetical protein
MDKVKRITDLVGQIKEVTIDEFGWLLYVHGINLAYSKEGKIFVFKLLSDLVDGLESNKNKPVTMIQSFMDIVYTKYEESNFPIEKARYIEYNTRTNKALITKGIPEAISERDECFYSSMMPIGTYYSDIVFKAITKKEKSEVESAKK